MAKQISELGASAAVAGADLFWLEQSGLPTKLSFTALQTALGALPAGTTTNAIMRWSGSAWVEETDFRVDASGNLLAVGSMAASGNLTVTSTAPQVYLVESGVTANNTRWSWTVDAETLSGRMWNDANSTQGSWVSVARTLNVADNVNFTTALQILTPPNTASASGEIRINARGDAFLNLISDNVSDAETNNPYIRFAQDGAAVISFIGTVGAADIGPSGETFTGMVNNGLAIHEQWAGGTIGLGIAGRCPVLVNDADQLVIQEPGAITDFQKSWHNGTDFTNDYGGTTWLRFTNLGSGILFQDGAECRWYHTDDVSFIGMSCAATVGSITTGGAVDSIAMTERLTIVDSDSASAYALTVTNAGSANTIARFIGDSDSLDILTVGAGDYQIRNSGQGNGITIYDGTGGIDIEYANVTMISCDNGLDVTLFQNGTEEAWTQDHNASGNTSGFATNDYGGTKRDVGFATMEEVTFTANTTVVADHWSQKCLTHTNATTHTLTFNTLSTVPNGAVMWVKARTGIVTLVDGTMVLTLYAGAALTTGNISVAIGGWATLHKTGNSAADVTGIGLT